MYLESYSYGLCLLQKEEKLMHLFMRCPFAKNCWLLLMVHVPSWLRPQRAVKHIKRQLRVPFVMELIIIMCWPGCSEMKILQWTAAKQLSREKWLWSFIDQRKNMLQLWNNGSMIFPSFFVRCIFLFFFLYINSLY
jgi:hypothetical protein